jgi:hypothetical protein
MIGLNPVFQRLLQEEFLGRGRPGGGVESSKNHIFPPFQRSLKGVPYGFPNLMPIHTLAASQFSYFLYVHCLDYLFFNFILSMHIFMSTFIL